MFLPYFKKKFFCNATNYNLSRKKNRILSIIHFYSIISFFQVVLVRSRIIWNWGHPLPISLLLWHCPIFDKMEGIASVPAFQLCRHFLVANTYYFFSIHDTESIIIVMHFYSTSGIYYRFIWENGIYFKTKW